MSKKHAVLLICTLVVIVIWALSSKIKTQPEVIHNTSLEKLESTVSVPKDLKSFSILKDEQRGMFSYMTICVSPMTNKEGEELGNYIYKTRQKQTPNLKISIYWNNDVAQACNSAGIHGESQFYNTFLDAGKRCETTFSTQSLNKFDDMSLYQSYINSYSEITAIKPIGYRIENQTVVFAVPVNSMNNLIYRTFHALGDGLRGCIFDRIPRLKYVKIIYIDNTEKELGHGIYGMKYWSEMIRIPSVPYEISTSQLDEVENLYKSYQSKLLSEKEYEEKSNIMHQTHKLIINTYYQDKWRELFVHIIEFKLFKELPLTTERP